LIINFPTIFADMVWPALFLEQRLLAVPVISAGLLLEYVFVLRITELGTKRSILADLVMNAVSTLAGILLIPIAGIAWELFPGTFLYHNFNLGTFNPWTWTATFLLAVAINTTIEFFVLRRFFKQRLGKRGFGWLFVANTLSVGLAFASFLIFPIPPG
jgi:hypothetical protein